MVLWEIESQETQGLILRGEPRGLDFTLLRLTKNKLVSDPVPGICLFLSPFSHPFWHLTMWFFQWNMDCFHFHVFSQLSDSEMWADLVKSEVPTLERWAKIKKKIKINPTSNYANICAKEKINLPLPCLPSCWVYSKDANRWSFWQETWGKEDTLREFLKIFQEG